MAGTDPIDPVAESSAPTPAPVPRAGLWANLSFKQRLLTIVSGAAVAAVGGTYAAKLISPTPAKVTAQNKLKTDDPASKPAPLTSPTKPAIDDIPPLDIPNVGGGGDTRRRAPEVPPIPDAPRELPSTVTAPKAGNNGPADLTIPTIPAPPSDRGARSNPADTPFRPANDHSVIRASDTKPAPKVPAVDADLTVPGIPPAPSPMAPAIPPIPGPMAPAIPPIEPAPIAIPEAPRPGAAKLDSDVPPIPTPPKAAPETIPTIPLPKIGAAPKTEPETIPTIPAPKIGAAPKTEPETIPPVPVPKKSDVPPIPPLELPGKKDDLPPPPPIPSIDVPARKADVPAVPPTLPTDVPVPPTKKDDVPPLTPVPMGPPMIDPVITVPMAPRSVGTPPTAPEAPRVSTTLVPAEGKKENYEEDWHTPEPGQPYSWISNFYYKSPEYAKALEAYNRERRKPGDEIVRVPPIWVLEEKYPNLVGKSASKEPTTRPAGLRFDPVEPSTSRSPAGTTGGSAASPTSPTAPPPAVPTNEYRVTSASGESIREIARKVFGDESAWRKIFDMNPDIDPTRPIPTGTTLRVGR